MTLRQDTQHNIGKQGTNKAWSSKKTVGGANNWTIASYCQRMASNEIANNKNHVQPFVHIFTKMKWVKGIFLHQLWALWALSVKIVYGTITTKCLRIYVTNIIMVWHNNVALWVYDVTELGVFWHMFFWGWDMAWDGPSQYDYWTQPLFLTHVTHRFKIVSNQLFNWPVLLNLASKNRLEIAYFSPF
mgnify:CR=1 FL=1